MNFFDYYGLTLGLEVSKSDLRSRYYAKSREVHPDQSNMDSEQQAAVNNEAFRVLSDEDLRIRHILTIYGEQVLDNEPLPPEFLMEMMEINEAIMEAESPEQLSVLARQVQAYETDLALSLVRLRQIWPSEPAQITEALTLLKDFSIKRRYILRIHENLANFAPDL
jgi:molecular chaperone HscB